MVYNHNLDMRGSFQVKRAKVIAMEGNRLYILTDASDNLKRCLMQLMLLLKKIFIKNCKIIVDKSLLLVYINILSTDKDEKRWKAVRSLFCSVPT